MGDEGLKTCDERDRESAKAIKEAGVATEREMRETDVPSVDSTEDLAAYIDNLVDRPHDYGTCVYAMSMGAVAAFNYVAGKLGVTGFQASCADLDILRRTRRMKLGFSIVDHSNLLYPQYRDSIPGFDALVKRNVETLAREAGSLLDEDTGSPTVRDWWRKIVAMAEEAKDGD